MTVYDERGNRIPLHVDLSRARAAQASPDPLARLRDAVATFADYPADEPAVATSAHLDGTWTGLTHGDLRALLARLEG